MSFLICNNVFLFLSNLIKVISIVTLIELQGQLFNKPVKTNYKYPYGYSLIGISKNLSDGLIDLNTSSSYSSDLFEVNIGISPDGFIQYAITKSSNKENGHIIHLIFIKENYL